MAKRKRRDINAEYEQIHIRNIKLLQEEVERTYFDTIDRIFKAAVGIYPKGDTFSLLQYPSLNRAVTEALQRFEQSLNATLVNGIKAEWSLSADKNRDIITAKYGTDLPEAVKKELAFQHQRGLQKFLTRKLGPRQLTLSDRVWDLKNQLQNEIERTLFTGIQEGTSARSMANELKKNLNEPDKLFRRVRDAEDNLRLSKAAREYHPGQGIYRSSFKNALRLTRHETNVSYRQSDINRWQNTPMVLGYRTRLSNSHPKFDICDPMSEIVFPVDFKWDSWHVNCLCSLIPELASKEEFLKYQDAILSGRKDFEFSGRVTQMPKEFTDYVEKNMDTWQNWKALPTFLQNNPKLIPIPA